MKNKPKQAEELEQQQEPEINKLTNRQKYFLLKQKEAEILNNVKNIILEELNNHDLAAGALVTRQNLPSFIHNILKYENFGFDLYLKSYVHDEVSYVYEDRINCKTADNISNLINAANIYRKQISEQKRATKLFIENLCNAYSMVFEIRFPEDINDKIKAIIQLVSYFAQFQDKNDFLIEPTLRFKNG